MVKLPLDWTIFQPSFIPEQKGTWVLVLSFTSSCAYNVKLTIISGFAHNSWGQDAHVRFQSPVGVVRSETGRSQWPARRAEHSSMVTLQPTALFRHYHLCRCWVQLNCWPLRNPSQVNSSFSNSFVLEMKRIRFLKNNNKKKESRERTLLVCWMPLECSDF